jgi:uncharacterized membrane protein YdbT with pleckstrin-like domain
MSQKAFILRPTFSYSLLRSLDLIAVSVLIVLVSSFFNIQALAFLVIPPMAVCIYRIIYWRLVRYEISTSQIKYRRGVFQLKVDFLELYRVKDFDQRQSFIMRLLRIMHVKLMTSDKSHPVLELTGIPVSNIPDVLRKLVETSRKINRVYEVD